MGYYTYYNLSIDSDDEAVFDRVVSRLEEMEIIDWVLDRSLSSANEAKWYEHDDDMKGLSKEFPSVLFELCGEGESHDDMWTTYYRDGKMQHCPAIITYEDFDPGKLV